MSSADSANNPGYLVLMKCSASAKSLSGGNGGAADDACIGWTGDTIYVKPTAETTISLSQIEVKITGNCPWISSVTELTEIYPS